MFFLKCIWLMCYCICFLCATSFVNLDAKNRLSSMPKWDQSRSEDNIGSLYKHWKNYPSFANSSYEEKNWSIWFVNNLQSLEWYNFELTKNVQNVQLNKENYDINETNSLSKQFFSEQSFHRKDKYDLISDWTEFESHQGKHEFFNCFNLYLRFWAIKYQIINEYWVEDIDNFGKIWIKILSQWSSLNYCLKWIFWSFKKFSKDFMDCSAKFNLWNKILVKNYMKRFEDFRTCFNIFSSQKYLLNKIWDNIQYFKHKKNTSIISYQIYFHIYAYLFSWWCLAKIYNQIWHAGNLTVINDTRLSDIMFMISDIFHAIYTTIPFFFHHLRCREESIMDSSKLSRNDEYLFSFWSIYILSLFAFIMVQKFLIIIKEGLQILIKFAKFWIILTLFYLIKKDYVLSTNPLSKPLVTIILKKFIKRVS